MEYKWVSFRFNGKENDNEVKGIGNQQDYGIRIYDPRIGRFLSVDPLIEKYPELTPFQFASNTPIQAIDLDGLEARQSILLRRDGTTLITVTIDFKVKNSAELPASILIFKCLEIADEIERRFSGKDEENGITYIFKVNFDTEIKVDEKKDFYYDFTKKIKNASSKMTIGRADKIGDTNKNRFQIKANLKPKINGAASSHEMGHGLGLRHSKEFDKKASLTLEKNNLMAPILETVKSIVNNDQRALISNQIKANRGGGNIRRLEPIPMNEVKIKE